MDISPEPVGTYFPSSRPFDKQFKVIIIGDAGSGKTSLLMRIIDGQKAIMS